MQRNWIRAAIVAGSFLLAACSGGTDSTGLKAAPTNVSSSRYMLASGVTEIPPGCTYLGGGWVECPDNEQ